MTLASGLVSPLVDRILRLIEDEVTFLFCFKAKLRSLQSKMKNVEDAVRQSERLADLGDKGTREHLDNLIDIIYDTDDLTEDYRLHLLQSNCSIRVLHYKFKVWCRMGRRVNAIAKHLDEICSSRASLLQASGTSSVVTPRAELTRGQSYRIGTSSVVVAEDIVGLEMEVIDVVALLSRHDLKNDTATHPAVFTITGMAGVGKTTLAQMVYNDSQIISDFDKTMWVCVSRTYQPLKLLKLVLRQACGSCGEAEEKSELDPMIQAALADKKIFLVLDNVWDSQVWNRLLRGPLHGVSSDSRILVTTQKQEVANAVNAVKTHVKKHLSHENAWSMLKGIIVPSKAADEKLEDGLESIGRKIANQCGGLPLAIKAVGGILKLKPRSTTEWNNVLENQTQLLNFQDNFDRSLYVCYDDLPPPLKRCFLYCSLFPKGFKIFQWDLLRMWIAEGFIVGNDIFEMEKKAEEYYWELTNRFLLQPQPQYHGRKVCKIHDLLHSLAVSLSGNLQLGMDDDQIENIKDDTLVRNLSLIYRAHGISEQENRVLEIVMKKGHLRTLVLFGSKVTDALLESICRKLKYLRILDLYQTGITKLPDSVDNLVHLKLLTLSSNPIVQLPNSISHLHNLQTLNLENCRKMTMLSDRVTKLSNLSYLSVKDTPLKYMPQGLRNLTNLATLDGFAVRMHNEKQDIGCKMEELQSLSNLRFLRIYNLERLSSSDEAEGANLRGKKNLRSLRLWCVVPSSFSTDDDVKNMEEVFKKLRPPPSLEELAISGFNGKAFPDWMTGNILPNLSWLRLLDCPSCVTLPPLGELPQLRVLSLNYMSAMVKIDPQLFRGKDKFPHLEVLSFKRMLSWEEWGDWEEGDSAFTRLKRLVLKDCPKLIALPQGLQFCELLTELQIKRAANLKCIEGLPSVHDMKLEGLLGLVCISNLPALESLKISKCSIPKEVVGTDNLRYLDHDHVQTEEKPSWLSKMESTPGICVVPRKTANNYRGDVEVRARHHSRVVSRAISLDSDDSDFDDY